MMHGPAHFKIFLQNSEQYKIWCVISYIREWIIFTAPILYHHVKSNQTTDTLLIKSTGMGNSEYVISRQGYKKIMKK